MVDPTQPIEARLAAAERDVIGLRQQLLSQAFRIGEERRASAQSEDLKAQLTLAHAHAREARALLDAERGAHRDLLATLARANARPPQSCAQRSHRT